MGSTRSVSARAVRTGATLCALVVATVACADMPAEEAPLADGPWLGVMLPPGLAPHGLSVISDRPAAPAVVPQGESGYRELAGSAIQADLETIVAFSRESRETAEVGEGQIWGRITGFPSGSKTIQWAVNEFRAAGIPDVELQQFDQDPDASIWLPLSWEVRLLGDTAFGAGSADVVLESFRPGVVERLGADYATLSEGNPRLIYCALSGFGQTGPYRALPGHDINYMALAGGLATSGSSDRPVSANRSRMKRTSRQESRAKKPAHGGGGIRQRRNKRWTW